MSSTFKNDFPLLILRITLGAVLLIHGLYKWLILWSTNAEHYFSALGLSGKFLYVVMFFELIAGFCLILGLLTRIFSLAIFVEMMGMVYVHFDNGFIFSNLGGGWEYPAFLSLIAIVLFILGGGRYSLSIFHKKLSKF